MATRAIKPKRDDTILSGWQSMPEQAPSVMREDQPTVARFLAMAGTLLLAVGALAMLAPTWNLRYIINPGWGFFVFTLGVFLILYHAFADKDIQFRRVYTALGLALVLTGLVLKFAPFGGGMGGLFLPYGIAALMVALILLLAVIRNEPDGALRLFLLRLIGGLGFVMLIFAGLLGLFNQDFLTTQGIPILTLGLLYVCGFVGTVGSADDVGYKAGLGLGVFGALLLAVAAIRSLWPLFFQQTESAYFIPSGLVLMTYALIFIAVSFGICSDRPLIVLTRRELASFFYSPIGYLVVFGLLIVGWINFWQFVNTVNVMGAEGRMWEPIVRAYIVDLVPVIGVIFVVPIITMRLLSEEQRTGTLEVLLTAPVNETSIVLSKFLASLIFFLFALLPWGLFLISVRAYAHEFDFRPMLSFAFALICTGAAFLSIGLFFSSITRNQIIAAVLTFAVMIVFFFLFFLQRIVGLSENSIWVEVVNYVSFIHLWIQTLSGQFSPRYLVFYISVAIFFLFLSVQVLEARKWK